MKSIIALVVLCTFTFVAAEDKCTSEFKSVLSCAKDQFPESERKALKDDAQAKTKACFEQAGCDAPNFESKSKGKGKRPGGMESMMKMPDSVKQCLKKKFTEKMNTKVNECLSKKNLPPVNISEFMGAGDGAEVHGEAHGKVDGHGAGLEAGMMAKFTVIKGVDKCCVDKFAKDTAKVKPLEQCLQDIKKSAKPQLCKNLKPCEDKLTGDCKKRGQDTKKALCQCKKDKEREIAGKLAELGKQDKVDIQTLMKAVADDQDLSDMMGLVDKCYEENNEEQPMMLKLAKQFMAGGGARGSANANANANVGGRRAGLGAAMQIEGRQCIIASDMLLLDANDQSECEAC